MLDPTFSADAPAALAPTRARSLALDEAAVQAILAEGDHKSVAATYAISVSAVLAARTIARLAPSDDALKAARRWLCLDHDPSREAFRTHALAAWMLGASLGAASDERIRDLITQTQSFHDRAAGGDTPSGDTWRGARRKAMTLAEEKQGSIDGRIAELSAAAAWPVSEASTVLADALAEWGELHVGLARAASGAAPLDHEAVQDRLGDLYQAALDAGTPQEDIDVFVLLERHHPDEAKALRDDVGLGRDAGRACLAAFLDRADMLEGRA